MSSPVILGSIKVNVYIMCVGEGGLYVRMLSECECAVCASVWCVVRVCTFKNVKVWVNVCENVYVCA